MLLFNLIGRVWGRGTETASVLTKVYVIHILSDSGAMYGCGPFGNKAIWEQSHLGTIGGPFGYNGGPFGYNGGPFGYNGGPFGYN